MFNVFAKQDNSHLRAWNDGDCEILTLQWTFQDFYYTNNVYM